MTPKIGKNILHILLFLVPLNLMAHSDTTGQPHVHIGSEISMTYLALASLAIIMAVAFFCINPNKKGNNNAK